MTERTCGIRLLDYNNYYNRIIKAEQLALFPFDTDGYSQFELAQIDNVNFELNDGVETRLKLRWTPTVVNQLPNYLIAYVPTNLEADDYDVTRWFIIEQRKLSGGMYQLALRRDLVADYWEKLIDAPMYIEKGVASMLDPARFNKEGVSLNQIKTAQRRIFDRLAVPWALLYMPKNALPEAVTISAQYNINESAVDGVYTTVEEYPFYQYINNNFVKAELDKVGIVMYFNKSWSWERRDGYYFDATGKLSGFYDPSRYAAQLRIEDSELIDWTANPIPTQYFTWHKAIEGAVDDTLYNQIAAETQKTYKIGDKFYKVEIISEVEGPTTISAGGSSFATDIVAWARSLPGVTNAAIEVTETGLNIPQAIEVFCSNTYTCRLRLVEVDTAQVSITIPGAEQRYHSPSLAYDVIAFNTGPVSAWYNYTEDDTIFSGIQIMSGAMAEAISTAISVQLAESEVYDIQLVPYYPDQNKIKYGGGQYYIYEVDNQVIPILSETNALVSQAYMLETVSGSFQTTLQNKQLNIVGQYGYQLYPSNNIWDFKVENECNMYRLVSPNFQGQFEFSATRNGGGAVLEVLFKYKPFTPFIQVRPQFSQLYGASYQDARGLICGGDFSLPRLSSAWQNYEASNKNFQTIFDRQVENLETNQRLDRINQVAGILTNTANAAMTGAKTSGGAGAILGSGASLGAGIFDFAISEARRSEVIDYTKDQFAAQMDNIRAMPNSIANVGAQTPANTIWPVLEFYTCTEAERTAFRKKLLYNGMTIGRVDTLRPLLENMKGYVENGIGTLEERFYYFQGRLIELNAGDAHEVTELAHELLLGIKIRGLGL